MTKEKKTYPKEIYEVPGMINQQERELFYNLAKEVYTGKGEIVEVGALFGASSTSFSAGIRDNKKDFNKHKRLHVYDIFICYPDFNERFFHPQKIFEYETDDNTMPYYLENVKNFEDYIEATRIDATKVVWDKNKKIEILFIDAAAGPDFLEKIINVFYNHLDPTFSIIVDQDNFYEFAWWINVKNGIFADYFQPLAFADASLVQRYIKPFDLNSLDYDMKNFPFEICQHYLKKYKEFWKYRNKHIYDLLEIQRLNYEIETNIEHLKHLWHDESPVLNYRTKSVVQNLALKFNAISKKN